MSLLDRYRFCPACGRPYEAPLARPRRCANPSCGVTIWANPIPVAVALVPVVWRDRTGLLVVRRGIEPRRGLLALVGGFVEEHERWQTAAAREVLEETGVAVDENSLRLFDAVSTEPVPDRILLFATAAPLAASGLPPFTPGQESQARGIVFGPGGLDQLFAFPLHVAAARRWFESQGIGGDHDHVEC